MIGGRFFLLLPWLLGFRTWPPGFVVAADREEGRSRGKLTACSRGVWLIWRRLVLVEIELEQVLPCSETAVHLYCSSRFGFGELEQERITIGKYIKFPFQRVLICLIRSSDEETAAVSISEVLSVRRRTSCATFCKGGGFFKKSGPKIRPGADYPA